MKTIPKSLHTVTVFKRFAEYIEAHTTLNREESLDAAIVQLGYHNAPDDYDLRGKALK